MTAKTYDRHSGKFIARIAENLPEMSGDVVQGWIDNLQGLQKFLVGLRLSVSFPTIKLGTGLKNANDFRRDLKADGFHIGDRGNDILGNPDFEVANQMTEVDLANVSVEELGLKDGAKLKDVCERAISLGLELCPNEVGPQLRRQYKNQPKGEWLRIAMKPIADSRGRLNVFNVGHDDDGLWLIGYYGDPGRFLNGYDRLVFVRPRK